MTAQRASVIIVSRHRPKALQRCLLSLMQQDHPAFEVIVVADPEGVRAAAEISQSIRRLEFDTPNISAARNMGLDAAAAEVVAFIDDDAVAEPSWLSRLCAPFQTPGVVASTGFVRGRNGISFQWRAAEVDHLGNDHPLAVTAPCLRAGTRQRAVKTQGTTCAFRTEALRGIGGFDPAFRFYLDEADVNLRLGPLGLTAIVPDAQVIHFYEESARRAPNRVPRSLREIAASSAVFLRRHAGSQDLDQGLSRLTASQEQRLRALTAKRLLTPREARDLMAGLTQGWQEGLARALTELTPRPVSDSLFRPVPDCGPRPGVVLAGRIWQARRLRQSALALRREGRVVSVICLAPTARAHWVRFTDDGLWWQSGGLFGREDRSDRRFRLTSFARRVAQITSAVARLRPVE